MTALITAAIYTAAIAILALGAGIAIISIRHDLMNPRVREEVVILLTPVRRVQIALIAVVVVLFAGRAV